MENIPHGGGEPRHRSFPEPDNPLIKPGSQLDKMAKVARTDFESMTDEDIETALQGEAKPASAGKDGRLQKKLPEEAVPHIMKAVETTNRMAELHKAFDGKLVAQKLDELKFLADKFKKHYGTDIESADAPARGDAADAAFAREHYASEKHLYEGMKREVAEMELGKRDPAALGAIMETRRGLSDLYMKLRKDFAYQHSLHDDIRREELNWVTESSPEAASLVRKVRVAEEQLERLEKENGLRE